MYMRLAFIVVLTTKVFADDRATLIQDMENRIVYLEGIVAQLMGKTEEIEKKLKDQALTKPLAVDRVKPKAMEKVSSESDLCQQLYDKGRHFLNNTAYREAELVFKELISSYPQHALVVNAKYWLGEIYLIRSDYQKASEFFAASYALYKGKHTGSALPMKASDALLKLAFALRGLGKKTEVCATLEQMKQEFPEDYKAKKIIVDRAKAGLKCEI